MDTHQNLDAQPPTERYIYVCICKRRHRRDSASHKEIPVSNTWAWEKPESILCTGAKYKPRRLDCHTCRSFILANGLIDGWDKPAQVGTRGSFLLIWFRDRGQDEGKALSEVARVADRAIRVAPRVW